MELTLQYDAYSDGLIFSQNMRKIHLETLLLQYELLLTRMLRTRI